MGMGKMGKMGKAVGGMTLGGTSPSARVTDADAAYGPSSGPTGPEVKPVPVLKAPVVQIPPAPAVAPVLPVASAPAPQPVVAAPMPAPPPSAPMPPADVNETAASGQARVGVPVTAQAPTTPPATNTPAAPLLPVTLPVGFIPGFRYTAQRIELDRIKRTDVPGVDRYEDPRAPDGYACIPGADDRFGDKIECYRLDCTDQRRGAKMELLVFNVAVGNTVVTVKHWADLQAARAWAIEGQFRLSQVSRVSVLDRIQPSESEAMRLSFYERQRQYVQEVFDSIANYYNELNIPWSIDPVARELYHKYLAGVGGLGSEYNKGVDYNGGNWYDRNQITPRVSNYPLVTNLPNANQGIFVRRARRFGVIEDRSAAPIHFRQLAGVRLVGPGSDPDNPRKSPYVFAQQAINEAFAIPNGLGGGTLWKNAWLPRDAMNMVMREDQTGWMPGWNASASAKYNNINQGWVQSERVERDATHDQRASFQDGQYANDWRSYGKTGYANTTGIQQVATPLRDYLDWAQEWNASLLARTPAQVLRDAREFVLRRNLRWVNAFGGSAAFIREIAGQNASIDAELKSGTTIDTVGAVAGGLVRGIGSVIPAVGPAFAGMIGGAIDVITRIFGAVIDDGTIVSYGRDDLGNFKPVFERAFLAGTIEADDAQPPAAVPPPPWFCRDEAVSAQAELTATNPAPVVPPPQPISGAKTAAKIVGVFALTGSAVAGLIAGVKRLLP